MTTIRISIKGVYENLSNAEKKVADYFLGHINDVFRYPIADLAKQSGVSKAAWVRFSKTIGFDGLKALKKALFSELHKDADESLPALPFSDIGDAETIDELIETAKNNSLRAIRDTATLLDPKAVELAAQKILCAKSVRIFGVGASALVGEDLHSKLLRINKNTFFSLDHHVQLVYAANMTSRDVGGSHFDVRQHQGNSGDSEPCKGVPDPGHHLDGIREKHPGPKRRRGASYFCAGDCPAKRRHEQSYCSAIGCGRSVLCRCLS